MNDVKPLQMIKTAFASHGPIVGTTNAITMIRR